jgi:hypothetical protein
LIADELFWVEVDAIGQVAGAIATFAAVLTALYFALREQSLRIRVSAGLWKLVNDSGVTPVITITIDNIGLRKVGITSIGWTTGYFGRFFRLFPRLRVRSAHQMDDYTWAINPRFPWLLEPGESRSTHFKRAELLKEFHRAQEGDLFRRVPWSRRYLLFRHRVYAGVYTKRRVTLGKVDPELTKLFEENYELNQPDKTVDGNN